MVFCSSGKNRARLHGSAFMWSVSVLLTLACVACPVTCVTCPASAWAKYTDVSTQYPASQDLTEVAREGLGEAGKSIYPYVVSAGDITDGSYVVPAYTSSRMCNFYASSADAAAKTNPNQVVLNVSGGSVTATFYMSGAYNALYFGSAEQAAALAPVDGLTPSTSYLVDSNDSYDTGHGPFTVQLASLNTEFSFAVYNGGTKGVEGGVWYNRLGSVIVTTDFAEAYVIGVAPTPEPDPSPTPEPEPDPSPTPDDSGSGGSGGGNATSQSENNTTPAGTNTTNNANQNGTQATQNEQTNSDNAAAADAQAASAGETTLGKRLTLVGTSNAGQQSSQTVLDGTMISLEGITPGQIAAISAVLVVIAGVVAFAVRYFLQMKGKPTA